MKRLLRSKKELKMLRVLMMRTLSQAKTPQSSNGTIKNSNIKMNGLRILLKTTLSKKLDSITKLPDNKKMPKSKKDGRSSENKRQNWRTITSWFKSCMLNLTEKVMRKPKIK